MAKELTVVSYIRQKDGSIIPLDSLSPEERAAWRERMIARINQKLSDYLSAHPEELKALLESGSVELIPEEKGARGT